MRQQRFACARLSHPYMTQSLPRLLTMTFTTAAYAAAGAVIRDRAVMAATSLIAGMFILLGRIAHLENALDRFDAANRPSPCRQSNCAVAIGRKHGAKVVA
jgi:hypothetical protein